MRLPAEGLGEREGEKVKEGEGRAFHRADTSLSLSLSLSLLRALHSIRFFICDENEFY